MSFYNSSCCSLCLQGLYSIASTRKDSAGAEPAAMVAGFSQLSQDEWGAGEHEWQEGWVPRQAPQGLVCQPGNQHWEVLARAASRPWHCSEASWALTLTRYQLHQQTALILMFSRLCQSYYAFTLHLPDGLCWDKQWLIKSWDISAPQ